ncbi:MAG: hypothetical protein Rubg2KO_10620 [Rubricoccaceae bacterium]
MLLWGCQPQGSEHQESGTLPSLEGIWLQTPEWSNEEENFPLFYFREDSVWIASQIEPLGWRSFSMAPDSIAIGPTKHGSDAWTDTFGLAVTEDTLRLSFSQQYPRSQGGYVELEPIGFGYFGDGYLAEPGVAAAVIKAHPSTRPPDRLALSTTPCYGSCPVFDIEIDSAGTVWYHGYADVDRDGGWVGTGYQSLFNELAWLASTLSLATPHESRTYGHSETTIVIGWIEGHQHVHEGSISGGFGNVRLLATFLYELRSLPVLQPTQTPYTFASRAALRSE